MRHAHVLSLPLLVLPLVACSSDPEAKVGPGGGSGASSATAGGNGVGGNGVGGSGTGGAAGSMAGGGNAGIAGSAGAGTGGSAGTAPVGATFCERWNALGPGDLPGFATSSQCEDFAGIPAGDAPCSGATNDQAAIAKVELAQNHVLTPTAEDYTTMENQELLEAGSVRPKFRLISHRPALLLVGVTGSGAAPEVRVTAARNGQNLGTLCLSGPASLPASVADTPDTSDRFSLSLPADWIRSGLELQIEAGAASQQIPASDLRVAGGFRHLLVEGSFMMYGDNEPNIVPKDAPDIYVMADELPAQSVVWAHFPVPIVFDPFTMSARGGMPARVVSSREGSFDEVGEALDIFSEIWRANGHDREAAYFAALDSDGWGGGLGGGNGSSGPASQLMIRHETGHHYGLPHLEDAYADNRYPFGKRPDGSGCVLGVPDEDGCGVGPFWKYFQSRGVFESPWDPDDASLYKEDPMAGGGNNWFGAYTDQWVLDGFQDHIYWDDEQNIYVQYDAASGEFVPADEPSDENYYERPVQRDVPIYTVFGSQSDDVSEVNVIQPPLHYRGPLLKTLDPTNADDVAWLSDNGCPNSNDCALALRVTFDGSVQTSVLINRGTSEFTRWAVNVPDQGTITRVELYAHPDVESAAAATFFDDAQLLVARDF